MTRNTSRPAASPARLKSAMGGLKKASMMMMTSAMDTPPVISVIAIMEYCSNSTTVEVRMVWMVPSRCSEKYPMGAALSFWPTASR